MGDARRASVVIRDGLKKGRRCYDSVRLSQTTARVPASLTLSRVLRQPGQPLAITEGPGPAGQPQNTLPIIIPSQSTPTELTPTALTTPGSLPISSLPARSNLPDDHVLWCYYLLGKAKVDAKWTWDQTMRAIITDTLHKALSTLAEKKVARQKVNMHFSGSAFTNVGSVPHSTPMASRLKSRGEARLAKLRPAIQNLLRENPNVYCYTTFPTADKLFAQYPIWQQAKVESDRRLIFEEHARVETTGNGSYRLHRDHLAATRLTPFFSRVIVREQSSTPQEHRGTCQPVQKIASRRVDEMANRAFDGTRVGRLGDRSGSSPL